jgi:hypothetical protein
MLIAQLTQAQARKDANSHRRVESRLRQSTIVLAGFSMSIATQGVRLADSMQMMYAAAGGCQDVFEKATNNGVDAEVRFSVSKRRVSATRIR